MIVLFYIVCFLFNESNRPFRLLRVYPRIFFLIIDIRRICLFDRIFASERSQLRQVEAAGRLVRKITLRK